MSGIRWFLIDRRYLSISVKLEFSAIDAPVEAFTAYILDITLRPLFAFHVASIWTAPFRCLHFTILLTSFESFTFNSDILETDEENVYPAPGYPGAAHLANRIYRNLFFSGYIFLVEWIAYCAQPLIKVIHLTLTFLGRIVITG